ncbi:SurA N-terminal domain-containing protein [Salipaludibacillus daqingensis]|uniref:SurA N-terminal domain-containing protein n=1 Tax=Salipaludibacillus daqingensis TaxID=3041001 RepID=UPI0024769A27|nr:SurA N-terminal domain-containing protein [Salipaludibacillus daqingensis]
MKRMNKKALLALPLSAAILLAACGGENDEANNGDNSANQENNNITEEENNNLASNENGEGDMDGEADMEADPEEAVATVNGEEIKMADLQAQMAQYQQMFAQQGVDFEDEENAEMLMQIQQGILDQLITQEVITQEARDKDIEVSEEELEAELEEIRAQFESEEELEEYLATQNYTVEEMEEEIRDILLIEEFRKMEHVDEDEFDVTEDEVREYYDQLAMQDPEIAEFEEIEDELESEVKEQQYIQQLRDDADIEILI